MLCAPNIHRITTEAGCMSVKCTKYQGKAVSSYGDDGRIEFETPNNFAPMSLKSGFVDVYTSLSLKFLSFWFSYINGSFQCLLEV